MGTVDGDFELWCEVTFGELGELDVGCVEDAIEGVLASCEHEHVVVLIGTPSTHAGVT